MLKIFKSHNMSVYFTVALILFWKINLARASLDDLSPCEQEQLEKLPDQQKLTNAQQLEAQLQELCHMSKAWDLTAKLSIPQLSDPEFDPVSNPVQLPLLPFQKTYLKSHRQCKDSSACSQSLTKRTLRSKMASFRAKQSRKFRRVAKREAPQVKVLRKEYRAMTDQERLAFQNAVIALKNKIVNSSYNAFDLHASLHSAAYSPQAHFGCSFIPFHRIYLLMLEKQLQEVSGNNALAIPYWDSTLDSSLPSPCDSIIFSNDLLGPSNGFVNTGPFANFRTPEGFLSRNCQGNRTIRPNDLRVMQSLSNYSQCCYCVSGLLELIHGTIHTLVNGIMNNLNRASFDPCFWMHHSFIDKIYEDLQATWKIKPSDPNFTAPACLSQGIDGLGEPMLPFGYRDKKTGQIVGLKNQDGLQPRFTKEDYEYAPSPNCIKKTCTGKYLVCDANVCKSRIRNGGRCDQRAMDSFAKNATNVCMDGYQCQRSPSGQYSCAQTPQHSFYYFYYA